MAKWEKYEPCSAIVHQLLKYSPAASTCLRTSASCEASKSDTQTLTAASIRKRAGSRRRARRSQKLLSPRLP